MLNVLHMYLSRNYAVKKMNYSKLRIPGTGLALVCESIISFQAKHCTQVWRNAKKYKTKKGTVSHSQRKPLLIVAATHLAVLIDGRFFGHHATPMPLTAADGFYSIRILYIVAEVGMLLKKGRTAASGRSDLNLSMAAWRHKPNVFETSQSNQVRNSAAAIIIN